MRKFLGLLSTVILSFALITGCSQAASDTAEVDDAVKAAENYKNVEYDINASENILSETSIQQRNEEIQPFLTESFYEKAVNTGYTTLPLKVSYKQKLSVKPENLQFKLEEQKKDIVELNYTVDLVLLDQGGKESQRVPMEGILTLFEVNGQWLVQGDRFDNPAFRKLIETVDK
ncbi:hypothetical protein H1230_29885 [Paenibacillus sp. 19GGS1-52]|uniref:hypothetical protein n=1 Tax=Paenibacillus sp. 19GGS1-52 TaxID=2758563 RepID=UPI001EFB9368|nr:hypothetical protein [Paenibacillus sp. 19GGS1-52]ULO07102.1 hypothetical protein H1230_29885 [Paenibacillus sp. 19GGS1-52]